MVEIPFSLQLPIDMANGSTITTYGCELVLGCAVSDMNE